MLYKTTVLLQADEMDPNSLIEDHIVIDLNDVIYIQGYVETESTTPAKFHRHSYIRFSTDHGFPIKDTVDEILPHWLKAKGKELVISNTIQQNKDLSV